MKHQRNRSKTDVNAQKVIDDALVKRNEIIGYLKRHKEEFCKNMTFQKWLFLAPMQEERTERTAI